MGRTNRIRQAVVKRVLYRAEKRRFRWRDTLECGHTWDYWKARGSQMPHPESRVCEECEKGRRGPGRPVLEIAAGSLMGLRYVRRGKRGWGLERDEKPISLRKLGREVGLSAASVLNRLRALGITHPAGR